MEIIYLLIPVALILVGIALKLFFWAVKDGQFEDLEGPGHSILFDDDQDLETEVKRKTGEQEKQEGETK